MEQLYIKYQEAKAEWDNEHKIKEDGWKEMKSLKGEEYKRAREAHEEVRGRE